MTSTLRFIRAAALAVVLGAGMAAQAEAAPIVSIDPVTQDANVGDAVSVNIVVSGLTEAIGGFSAVLSFNDAILAGVSYANDPDGNFDGEFDLSFGFGGLGLDESPLDLFVVGAPNAAQGGGFILATVNFSATAGGLSPLTLSGVVLSNADGTQDIIPGVANGEVCVSVPGAANQGCPRVPEPGLLALLGAGLSAIAVRRRNAAASRA